MTSAEAGSGIPERPLARRPHGSGDAWVDGPDGRRFWGTFGAAGLMLVHPERGVLLQHRAEWSHFGGTWGLPGGARHEHESPATGAVREAEEEAGVPPDAVRPLFTAALDLGWWNYTTVVALARRDFEPVVTDAESIAVRWVPRAEIADLPLHPGFGASWPLLAKDLDVRPTLVVDGANVVGSRPDGWWRDRAGAAARLAFGLEKALSRGFPAALLGLDQLLWWPRTVLVVEGDARSLEAADGGAEIVRAPRDGDASIVQVTEEAVRLEEAVTVVTADRKLALRCTQAGARVVGPRALLDVVDSDLDE